MSKPQSRRRLSTLAAVSALALWLAGAATPASSTPTEAMEAPAGARPTIVLVHGAFVDASGWKSVYDILTNPTSVTVDVA